MINDVVYKKPFIFALTLHLIIILCLCVRFSYSSRAAAGLIAANSIINAFAVNERDLDNQVNRSIGAPKIPAKVVDASKSNIKQPASVPAVTVKSDNKNAQLQVLLKKNLLSEQARELAELKKEKQKYKQTAAKHQEQQLQKELQAQISSEQKQLADSKAAAEAGRGTGMGTETEEHGSRMSGEVNRHLALIRQAIDSQWLKPEGLAPVDFCKVEITVAPGGEVLNVRILSSSGNIALERSAQAAIFKASPLPVPEDVKLFDEFRILKPTFRAEGMVGN